MATASVHRIYKICGHCGGDGKIESVTQAPGQEPVVTEVDCQYCNGHSIFLWGYMTENTYEITIE